MTVDCLISDDTDMDIDGSSSPHSHPLDLDPRADEELQLDPSTAAAASPLPNHNRPNPLQSHPIRYGELVAHLSNHPRVFVATCRDHEEGKATEDIIAQPAMATLITAPPHLPAGATTHYVALMSAMDCVEPTSNRAALTSAQTSDWQTAMHVRCYFG
jgi:hypothetical protein